MMTESVTVTTTDPNRGQGPPPNNSSPLSFLKINAIYFTTIPGIIKLLQLVSL